MEKQTIPVLKIDEEFRNLIRPLYRQEYLQLEANILADGCRDPISVWNGVIIDGHNRYEICTRHGIPFSVQEIEFECREAAIAWICANQLGRRNLTDETRKFLIGLQYENEKIVNNRKNALGHNQHTQSEGSSAEDGQPNEVEAVNTRSKTAKRIAEANHISHGTVEKYAIYTRALEEIGRKEPKLVPKILSGRYKISHNSVLELARLSTQEVRSINRRLERSQTPYARYMTTRKEIQNSSRSDEPKQVFSPPSIKDMPMYDPDAEITGLTLTIPSWASSITRIKNGQDLKNASDPAKNKLLAELLSLMNTINAMLDAIKEA